VPELPEVETIVRGLDKRVSGDTIDSVWIGSRKQPLKSPAAKIASTLEDKQIVRVHRTGKHIVFDLESQNPKRTKTRPDISRRKQDSHTQWIVHLGMTGRMLVCEPSDEIAKHTHLIANLASGRELRPVASKQELLGVQQWVNPPIAVFLIGAIFVLIPSERRRAPLANFDILGTVLVTGGMLLLVYALVKAPDQGWGSVRTITELVGAGVLLAAFVINERRVRNPLIPLSVFRIRGLAAADVTQLVGVAGFLSMFFFLTLYMQNVLGFSPLQTGAAYLPLTAGVVVSAGISSQLLSRVGTRPLIIGGAAVVAAGLFYVSRVPLDGSYLTDLFPGLMIVSLGVGAMFVAVITAANAGVPADKAGLAAALLNSSQQIGAALGLAVLSAIATARTSHLLAAHTPPAQALTSGFHRALFAGAIFVLATTVIAMRTNNSRGETQPELDDSQLERAEELV
jgi:hypothetical protein